MLASLNRVASRAAPRVTARPLSFLASDLAITLNTAPKVKPDPDTLKFGEKFSDHMLEIDWTQESGWGKPRISAFANLSVSPAITGLHYGIQCFEGMKCYHSPKDDSLRLFRPDMNMKRLNSSMNRLAMPEFDSEQVRTAKRWAYTQQTNTLPRSTHLHEAQCMPGAMHIEPNASVNTLPLPPPLSH